MYCADCTCRACGSGTKSLWEGRLLDSLVRYFECRSCGYVQTETPYWLDRAYSNAINISDTGIMVRNQTNARIVLATLLTLGTLRGKVVDCAGGYGILVRLLRDYGVNAFWSDRYCQNLVARGFQHNGESADLVTAFEAFEHFINPAEELDRLLSIAPSVLLSTEIIAEPAPAQDQWWYYGREHGQHIGFFRPRTLQMLAESRGKYLISDGQLFHLITTAPANSLVWRALLKVKMAMPVMARSRLRSKTLEDHHFISRSER